MQLRSCRIFNASVSQDVFWQCLLEHAVATTHGLLSLIPHPSSLIPYLLSLISYPSSFRSKYRFAMVIPLRIEPMIPTMP
jgi:hypothetical protein